MKARPKVVVTHWIHPEAIEYLRETCEVVSNQTRETLPRAEIMNRARGAEALMVFMPDVIDRAFLDQCKTLKVIAGAFKGYDNIDVDACTGSGVWVTIAHDFLTIPTAELAVGLLLALARNILPADRLVRSGRFTGWRPVLYGTGLQGKTAGIVGMGKIGRAIAERLAGFRMNILYSDPVAGEGESEDALPRKRAGLDELLVTSDYVLLSLPLTPDSLHLINGERLGRMKRGSYLINIGRGSVVDEAAVAKAIQTGSLAGYAADVFEMEDLSRPDRPVRIFPGLCEDTERTVFTAHLGSAVDDVRRAMALDAAANIGEALAGVKPKGAINNPRAMVRR
ncbi:MAG: phosphonate dehydrogenase [Syntrophales bacterium]